MSLLQYFLFLNLVCGSYLLPKINISFEQKSTTNRLDVENTDVCLFEGSQLVLGQLSEFEDKGNRESSY